MKTPPPPGRRRFSDWKGKRVRSVRKLRNGFGEMPVGTIYKLHSALGGLSLSSEPCKCCGIEQFIRRVHPRDVEVVYDEPATDAPAPGLPCDGAVAGPQALSRRTQSPE